MTDYPMQQLRSKDRRRQAKELIQKLELSCHSQLFDICADFSVTSLIGETTRSCDW